MGVGILCAILVLLVCLSGFFSASETGMMSLNRYRLRHLVKLHHKQAIRVSQLLARPDSLLSVVLIGNTIANIAASILATLIGQSLYGEWGVLVATVSLTLIILVFAEIAPKTLGVVFSQSIAFRVVWLLQVFQWLFTPIIWLITRASTYLLKSCGVSTDVLSKDMLSGEELRTVVSEEGGLLHIEQKKMLVSILDLEKATVEDIMIPKAELVGLDIAEPWHKIIAQLETAQHTRLPVYRDNIEQLLGMVHVKQVLHLAVAEGLSLASLLSVTEAPYYVLETMPLSQQVVQFRKLKKRSAFVVDEYGDIQGLVTLEDILEEVVGEFTTDISALTRDIILQEEGRVLIEGSITLRELNRHMGWLLPLTGPKTLSGLIIEQLGFIPPAECCLKLGQYYIEILKVQDNLVRTVRMWT